MRATKGESALIYMKYKTKILQKSLIALFSLALVACGGGGDGDDGGGDGGNGDSPVPVTTSCAEVCDNVTSCDPSIGQTECIQTCEAQQFGASCKTCIAERPCEQIDSACTSLCLDEPPAKNPYEGQTCKPAYYDAGGIGNNQGGPGNSCSAGDDCASNTCVFVETGFDQTVSFCDARGDCRNDPQNADYECPQGWDCVQVSEDKWYNEELRWVCMDPDLDACPPPGNLEDQL